MFGYNTESSESSLITRDVLTLLVTLDPDDRSREVAQGAAQMPASRLLMLGSQDIAERLAMLREHLQSSGIGTARGSSGC